MFNLKSLTAAIAAVSFSLLTLSCAKDGNSGPKIDNSLAAEVVSQDFTKVSVKFIAGADVESIKYSFGSAITQYQDSIKFAYGVLASKTIDASEGGFSISPREGEPVVIYIRPIASDGSRGDIICLKAAASPLGYEISKASLGSFIYTVSTESTTYAGLSILAMDASTPGDWGMSAEEIVDMYALYGMLTTVAPGESAMVELNGEPNVEHIAGVVYWNEDYTYSIKVFNFTSGSVIKTAPASSIEATVTDITSSTANLNFTPSETACGYFYKLFTKEDYDEAREEGQKVGEDPDEHVRDQVAAGGSMNYLQQTDKRSGLSPNTEYVLTCYPYNINGSQGWGPSKIINFKTGAE